jgi:phosphate binding protein
MRFWKPLSCVLVVAALCGCEPSGSSSATGTSGQAGSHAPVGVIPEGAKLPTVESIQDGTYRPLSRPLFLYVNVDVLKKPVAQEFLRYYFGPEGRTLVGDSGYVPLANAHYDAQLKQLNELIGSTGATDGQAQEDIHGQLLIDGSSTVAPISTAVAEEFSHLHPEVRVPVGTSGTGGGFKKFCAGEIDICNASRAIKDSEKAACEKAGIHYLELTVGMDGITVVVNPSADWIAGISVADLKKIWAPDSPVEKWSDLNPDFPDAPIKLFGPDTDSGTFEYFTEEVCGGKGVSRSDYQQSGDDNFLVTGVAGDQYALGYFGFAYYVENQGKLKPLAIAP